MIARITVLICLLTLVECSILLECVFKTTGTTYYCEINGVNISNEKEEIFIGRVHSGTNNDLKVTRVDFVSSSLSHIPVEIFSTFKSLNTIYVTKSKLKKLNKLSNCSNLVNFYAFDNEIKEVKKDSFAACANLKIIHLYNNPIERLEDKFFNKNILKLDLRFDNCKINAIEPTFLDGVKEMFYLALKNNTCIDKAFNTISPANADGIKPFFYKCFENYKNLGTTTTYKTTYIPTEPPTEPTEPTTAPTEPTTKPTDPTTAPTEPTTAPTEPTTPEEPTDPTTEPTTTEEPRTTKTTQVPTTIWTPPTTESTLLTTVSNPPPTTPSLTPNNMNCTFNIFKMKFHCETDIDVVFFHSK